MLRLLENSIPCHTLACGDACKLADTKSTHFLSPDLHLSVIKIRPDRGKLICSKICSKKLKNKIKGRQLFMPEKRSIKMPDKCNVLKIQSTFNIDPINVLNSEKCYISFAGIKFFLFFQMKNKYWVNIFLELTGQTSVIYDFSYFPNGQTSILHLSILFFTPPMLQTFRKIVLTTALLYQQMHYSTKKM